MPETARTIYLLEDDDSIRELVVYTLNSAGLPAEGFATPSAFWEAVKNGLPSLVLLDIMLPEEDGLSVLRKLRSAATTKHLPIILLTAKSSEFDKVIGLDGGADDYISKPFGMMELLARVRALLRRAAADAPSGCYTVGSLTVDTSAHEVRVNGQPVSLTLKEFELLRLLMENRGIVLTRDHLLDTVWGYAFDGESRTVDVHIRTLRQKLGDSGDCIETVRGVGYKIR
jgi:two-component system alkaline phosphatase synthesis response regulator PhoP